MQTEKSYPSDVTREQFEHVRPLLESARKKTKPRQKDIYEVFNGLLYILRTGCQWRLLPHEFPKWRTVHEYFLIWSTTPTENNKSILEAVLKKIGWRGKREILPPEEDHLSDCRCAECQKYGYG